jgi:hypothetical protein
MDCFVVNKPISGLHLRVNNWAGYSCMHCLDSDIKCVHDRHVFFTGTRKNDEFLIEDITYVIGTMQQHIWSFCFREVFFKFHTNRKKTLAIFVCLTKTK